MKLVENYILLADYLHIARAVNNTILLKAPYFKKATIKYITQIIIFNFSAFF